MTIGDDGGRDGVDLEFPIPFGNAVALGEIVLVDDGREYTVRQAILIRFDTDMELRNAIAGRRLVFGLFGETPEEVQGR